MLLLISRCCAAAASSRSRSSNCCRRAAAQPACLWFSAAEWRRSVRVFRACSLGGSCAGCWRAARRQPGCSGSGSGGLEVRRGHGGGDRAVAALAAIAAAHFRTIWGARGTVPEPKKCTKSCILAFEAKIFPRLRRAYRRLQQAVTQPIPDPKHVHLWYAPPQEWGRQLPALTTGRYHHYGRPGQAVRATYRLHAHALLRRDGPCARWIPGPGRGLMTCKIIQYIFPILREAINTNNSSNT